METLIGVFRCFLPRLYRREMRRGAILSIPMIAGIAVAHWALVSTRALAMEAVDPRDTVGSELSPWRPGSLDIHQIVTGRGNAAFA